MSRSVPEWVGKTDDTPPSKACKARIMARQDGICGCGCGVKLGVCGERIEFDHIQALILEGENRESNLQALRPCCHKPKTKRDVAQKAKEAHRRANNYGLKNPKPRGALIPGSKGSGWRRPLNGPAYKVKE